METIVERPAALDVHKAQVTACARVPDRRGRREQHVAEFASTVRGLLALRDWLDHMDAEHGPIPEEALEEVRRRWPTAREVL